MKNDELGLLLQSPAVNELATVRYLTTAWSISHGRNHVTEYESLNGCRYRDYGQFTVVVTPHAVRRENERSFNHGDLLPWYTLYAMLEVNNRNQYVLIKGFQCFLNKKFNTVRNRWELEVISFTPDNWHKRNDKLVMTIS